jgi:hypothetical protein
MTFLGRTPAANMGSSPAGQLGESMAGHLRVQVMLKMVGQLREIVAMMRPRRVPVWVSGGCGARPIIRATRGRQVHIGQRRKAQVRRITLGIGVHTALDEGPLLPRLSRQAVTDKG